MMQIQSAPRSASMPQRNDIIENNKKPRKKHHSLTFKEKLRSTFLRKVKKPKSNEEINYGKIVILGDEAVGKTSLIHRFSNNYFTEQYTPTVTTAMFDVTALVECDAEVKIPISSDHLRKAALLNSHVSNTKHRDTKRQSSRVISMGDSSIQDVDVTHHTTGLKSFKFQLVDTTADITKSIPVTYRATVADAHGFLLICSYDKPDSLKYIQNVFEDIKNMRQNNNVPIIIVVNKCDLSSAETVNFENSVIEMTKKCNIEWCEISALNSEGFQNMMELVLNEMNAFEEEERRERNLLDDYAFLQENQRNKYNKYGF